MNFNNQFTLSGRYQIIKPLGQGTSGSVFLARQQSLEQDRAIKVFPKTDVPTLFAVSEAQILKSIRHPGIPAIYDFEEDESFYYLVEEYIEGESLEAFLLHQQSISGNLFFQFCDQLCGIFSYLHTLHPAPILYRDLKPEHIIVCGLQIKLIDFSVASFIGNSGNDVNSFGNVEFSAPELANGRPITPASDIYSIGKVLEFMTPYLDASTNRMIQPIIQKAIHADPKLRYQTVSELTEGLQKADKQKEGTNLRKTIAVIGSHSGCGSTHIAVSLVTQLNALGISSIYQEANWNDSLRKAIRQLKHAREHNGCYSYQCFKGYPKYDKGIEINMPDAQVVVRDYGLDYTFSSLAAADQILYICGGAVWHRDDAKPKDFLLQKFGDRLKIIANLCDRSSAAYFARKFSIPVYPYPYNTGIFRPDREKQDFVHWLSFEKGRNRLFLNIRNLISRLLHR